MAQANYDISYGVYFIAQNNKRHSPPVDSLQLRIRDDYGLGAGAGARLNSSLEISTSACTILPTYRV